ncbi:MAG TPA: GGDEF domain-containing protein [Stellaceae bacterium]|jgi:diguanylate cyclase (GGDEF)-like protein|nr:GGDEF domain-containing protein [Stellaceae bacterium]
MLPAALKLRKSDEAFVVRRPVRHLNLVPPANADHATLLAWANDLSAAAHDRVKTLEQRIAHLETMVSSDELTGLLNRRGFLGAFTRAHASARRGGPAGVIVICDLDGFKQVNDLQGHARGDEVLRQIGGILRHRIRKMDAAARFGGDEFAIMLVGVSLATAKRKCHTLAREINALGLGASFGLAAFDGEDNEETVMHCADMAMYAEKRRNTGATGDEGEER